MANCRSCGALIKWVELASGKMNPCDPEPVAWDDVDEGMTLIGEDGIVYKSNGMLLDDNQSYFVSHFSTCPDAEKWRKR